MCFTGHAANIRDDFVVLGKLFAKASYDGGVECVDGDFYQSFNSNHNTDRGADVGNWVTVTLRITKLLPLDSRKGPVVLWFVRKEKGRRLVLYCGDHSELLAFGAIRTELAVPFLQRHRPDLEYRTSYRSILRRSLDSGPLYLRKTKQRAFLDLTYLCDRPRCASMASGSFPSR